MSATFPGQDRAKHMGELKRGDEHVPSFITALQLTHVLGAVLTREGGAHRTLYVATSLRRKT